ncbi:MAG TPA: alpha/beta hydrolase [Bacteroidia bacterium]|jgi:pimeloyl-ACP methyl ester carboxylesterase|nr:alpha/beta hydrolase [Bacteroidia bacterium]
MKIKGFFLILLFSCSTQLHAESWYSFANKIAIAKYAGLQVKMEAAVRTEITDEEASARLWFRADKAAGYGLFENMWEKPIKSKEWKVYSLEGKIDEDAVSLAFGALTEYSGSFYYDDFKLSVKAKEGNWEVIYQTNFENGLDGWKAGIVAKAEPALGTNKCFTTSVYNTNLKDHQKCLKIAGVNVPDYGHSKTAGKYAKVNGINLYYEVYGEGKPLVILHGNGGSIENAEPHLEFFMKKYKVIAIDTRGQGKSIDNTSELTYDLMASDINELLEQLNIDSAYVWGHSDGAILSLILAMDYPKKVKKAIAYAANLIPDSSAVLGKDYLECEDKALHSDNAKEKQLNMLMYKYPNIPFSALHKITADILVMSGDNDVIQLSHTLEIYKNIKRANLCILPAATHGGAWQKPQLFQQLATDFFEKPFVK